MQTETRDEMRERIIEAALKRFTHYSASKTTMNEIADDLHCSKASLYYYFPDKKPCTSVYLKKQEKPFWRNWKLPRRKKLGLRGLLMEMISIRHAFAKKVLPPGAF